MSVNVKCISLFQEVFLFAPSLQLVGVCTYIAQSCKIRRYSYNYIFLEGSMDCKFMFSYFQNFKFPW